ncbi:MAG: hypothetical protein Q8Q88_09450 [Phenylobacterium sp.]|uniref:hypothetical protein n=1 Tax=Phenylobacterium sp. TaxID=1871053 RepID=UPI0027346332|nr:hypothetical protein [Phenylobacterium sp.]MDP3747259.1 hypothetical protein [Phenylobacterium sp.]
MKWAGRIAAIGALGLSGCSTVNDGVGDVKFWDGRWEVTSPGAGMRVTETTPFSITLDTAFIKSFQELQFSQTATVVRRNPLGKHGEIAVLVKSVVASDEAPKAVDSRVAASFDDYRLIYYSDDVYPNQFLNFDTAVVHGPGRIEGGSVRLEFVILELDRTSEQAEQLLSKIADLSKTPLGLTGPTAGTLLSLGTTLFTSANDDRQFKFEVNFSLDDGPNPLRFGRYVIIRQEDRTQTFDWQPYCVNEQNGRLYYKGNTVGCAPLAEPIRRATKAADDPENERQWRDYVKNEFRADTYLSLTVAPRAASSKPFPYETFGALATRIRTADNGSIKALNAAAADLVLAQKQEANKDDAMGEWFRLEEATRRYATSLVYFDPDPDPAKPGVCMIRGTNDDDAVRDAALADLRLKISILEGQLAVAKKYLGPSAKPDDRHVADAWTVIDFQGVARAALSFAGDPKISPSKTLDPANVDSADPAAGMFRKDGIEENLKKVAVRRANALKDSKTCGA